MKREGRQHGMVRTFPILPSSLTSPPGPKNRAIDESDSPLPTAGLFTNVPIEPTNHSKFTGKCSRPRCSGCRMHPVCKSKNKIKGSHKLRSCDVGVNCRLISWRVVDSRPGLNLFHLSASGIVDHLCDRNGDDDDEEDDYYDSGEMHIEHHEQVDVRSRGDDDEMEFCHVGFVVDHVVVDDQAWCLVGEM